MKRYTKEIDGKTVIRKRNEIVLKVKRTVTDKKTGEPKEVTMSVYNPKEEQLLADGWVEYVTPVYEPTEEELLQQAKNRALRRLKDFDESEEVNDCIVEYQGQELHYWASKTERDALKGAVRDCISMGRDTYRLDLREKGISLPIPCEALLQMLASLEVYAIDCYNKTTDHEYAIKALQTVDEVEDYDFRKGYPEKLRFVM